MRLFEKSHATQTGIRLAPSVPGILIICGLAYAPFLLIRGLYGDDWVWFWVWWVESPGMLFEYMRQVSHPGYWLPLAFFYGVGGAYAPTLAKIVVVATHFASSVLIYHILRRPRLTRSISVWVAAIYLLSPFYYVHGVLVQSPYDVFMLFYLLSVWLMRSARRLFNVLALGAFLVSLSFETLIFLEPLRVLYVYRGRRNIGDTIRRCAPFWVAAVGFVIIRLVWLQPYGHYAGYNQLSFAILPLLINLAKHGMYYGRAAYFTLRSTLQLIPWPVLAALGALGFFALWLFKWAGSLPTPIKFAEYRLTVRRVLFGVLLAALGALPYALLGRAPALVGAQPRFAYVSLLGVSIVVVAVVAAIPQHLFRTYALGALVALLSLSSLQVTKWYIYSTLVERDLIAQMNRTLLAVSSPASIFRLRMVPPSRQVLVMGRSMSAEDLNVPLNLLRGPDKPLVFVYDEEWWDNVLRFPPNTCTIAIIDRHPCSEQVVDLEYRLNPDAASVERVSYWTLFQYLARDAGEAPPLGTLTSIKGWSPPAQTVWSVPETPGGRVAAGILQLSGESAH
jgi:hypothetical protein